MLLFIILKDLYGLGARRIGMFGIPPIGCLPSQRTLKGGEERQCVDNLNQAAKLFNNKLEAYSSSQGNKLPNSRLVYVDTYNVLLDVIDNPQRYGTIMSVFCFLESLNVQDFSYFCMIV